MPEAISNLVSVGSGVYVVGMTWKESSSKTAKAAAKEDALALIDGADEEGARACFAISESADRKSVSYGVSHLSDALNTKQTRNLHPLAASLASQSEDGLYVAQVTPVAASALKADPKAGVQSSAEPVFWVVGLSGGVVIPRTDLLYASADEMQSNLSMLRAFAPDLPVFVESGIEGVFFHDQQSWSWPASMPGSKSRPVSIVGAGLAGSSLFGSNIFKAGAGVALLVVLAGGGYMGWGAYQDHLARQAPDPAVLAQQQQQAYEARLLELYTQFSDQALSARWNHVWNALAAARLVGAAGGYSLDAFACGMQGCSASFIPVPGLVHVPDAVMGRLAVAAPGVAMQENTAQRLLLEWTPPVAEPAADASAQQALAWAASRPTRTYFDATVQALSRPMVQALNPTFRISSSAPGQPAGGAVGVAAVSVLSQTDVVPPDAVSVQVLSTPLQMDVLAVQGWAQGLAGAMRGRSAALQVQFSPEGVAQPATVQVVSVVRL